MLRSMFRHVPGIGGFRSGMDRVDRVTRLHYRRERPAWLLLSVLGGAIEGGVVGVIAKNAWQDVVPEFWLHLAVAFVTGAPAFANITSFFFAGRSPAANRVGHLVRLQMGVAACVLLMALAPRTPFGLIMLMAGAAGGRVCWTGVVTLRAAVWQSNYPRDIRATVTGRLAVIQAIFMAATTLLFGAAMSSHPDAFHLVYALATVSGIFGAIAYGRVRMRRPARHGNGAPRAGAPLAPPFQPRRFGGLRAIWQILRDDPLYRRYMRIMFIFGIGNLATTPIIVILLRDLFGYGYFAGIMATSAIPIGLMPLAVPFWSRMLDRMHVVHFRCVHAWSFVSANVLMFLAIAFVQPTLLWLSVVFRGAALAGGVLGWNLGHQDFGTPERSSDYMAVHVTLTGVRGLIGPALAVALYEVVAVQRGFSVGGGAVYVCVIVLNVIGAVAFMRMRRVLP